MSDDETVHEAADDTPPDGGRPRDGDRRPGATDPLLSFLSQLRGMTDQLGSLGRLADAIPLTSALRSIPGMGQLPPMPGAVTAAQIAAIATAVSAQRRSIQAMQTQLSAFDAQLGVLESILGPLSEWSGTWADIERRFTPGSSAHGTGDDQTPPTARPAKGPKPAKPPTT